MKRLLLQVAGSITVGVLFSFAIPAKRSDILSFSDAETSITMQDTIIPAKVQLEETIFKDMSVLYINDTAAATETVKDVLGKGYGELMQFIQQNKLQPRRFMAWYYSTKPPWPMDVAVETVSMPPKLSGRIQSRIQKGGDVLIAHVWGPYDQVGIAYVKIESWLKENKRKAKGNPFEVYVNDPSAVKNPSEIRTDIYQPIE
jgi:effector-binding domain-containing protein